MGQATGVDAGARDLAQEADRPPRPLRCLATVSAQLPAGLFVERQGEQDLDREGCPYQPDRVDEEYDRGAGDDEDSGEHRAQHDDQGDGGEDPAQELPGGVPRPHDDGAHAGVIQVDLAGDGMSEGEHGEHGQRCERMESRERLRVDVSAEVRSGGEGSRENPCGARDVARPRRPRRRQR